MWLLCLFLASRSSSLFSSFPSACTESIWCCVLFLAADCSSSSTSSSRLSSPSLFSTRLTPSVHLSDFSSLSRLYSVLSLPVLLFLHCKCSSLTVEHSGAIGWVDARCFSSEAVISRMGHFFGPNETVVGHFALPQYLHYHLSVHRSKTPPY